MTYTLPKLIANKSLFLVVSTASLLPGPTVLMVLCPAQILAQSQAKTQPTRNPVFVTGEQLSATSILAPPTSPESLETLGELEELHRLQETRTADQIRHAQEDDREESIFAFASVIGPRFNRATLPVTAMLSDNVRINERIIVNPVKKFFRRPRPYRLDPTIQPVCRTTKNRQDFSYPSGHGTTGYLEALVLIQMVPEKRDAILSRADDYAHNREICGVHYPSDEEASRTVAYAMIGIMLKNPQFQAELAAARAELRGQLGQVSSYGKPSAQVRIRRVVRLRPRKSRVFRDNPLVVPVPGTDDAQHNPSNRTSSKPRGYGSRAEG